jgi:hypothetical protein
MLASQKVARSQFFQLFTYFSFTLQSSFDILSLFSELLRYHADLFLEKNTEGLH